MRESIIKIAEQFFSHGHPDGAEIVKFGEAVYGLAQPAAVEPAKPVAWMWRKHGWTITAHSKHRSINRHVDLCQPPTCTINDPDFIDLIPLYAAPSPAVTEPARKAIDAQGAEPVKYEWRFRNTCKPDGGWSKWQECSKEACSDIAKHPVVNDLEYEYRTLYASPLPTATLGKAPDRAEFEAWCIRKGYNTNKWHGDGSSYVDSHVLSALEGWNAHAALAQQPAASDVRDALRWREIVRHHGVLGVKPAIPRKYAVCEWSEEGQRWFYLQSPIAETIDESRAPQSTPAVHAGKGDAS